MYTPVFFLYRDRENYLHTTSQSLTAVPLHYYYERVVTIATLHSMKTERNSFRLVAHASPRDTLLELLDLLVADTDDARFGFILSAAGSLRSWSDRLHPPRKSRRLRLKFPAYVHALDGNLIGSIASFGDLSDHLSLAVASSRMHFVVLGRRRPHVCPRPSQLVRRPGAWRGTRLTVPVTWGDVQVRKLCSVASPVELVLTNTQITDAGLVHLAQLPLQRLSLDRTHITDAGLVHLTQLPSLHSMSLCRTQITDAGLVHLRQLSSLQTLALRQTQITDAGLVDLSKLPLLYLNLTHTQVTDAGLVHLSGLPLTMLDLTDTQITDAGLVHLSGLPLTMLDLTDTQITDAGLVHLAELQLERLLLDGTQITDAGLLHLTGLPLRELRVRRTRVTDKGLETNLLDVQRIPCKVISS
jgi:hypothetical protein